MMRIDPYRCICCGVCEVVCPFDAIRGNSNRYFIKSEDCYYCGWCVFEITSPPGVLVDPAWPPTYIVVDDLMKARFSEEKESIAIWEQERDIKC